jgi:hypothetical protein
LYGGVVGVLVVVLSRIVGAMIADPATATTPVENATGRERAQRVVERAGSTSQVADGGPKDLASKSPSQLALEGKL